MLGIDYTERFDRLIEATAWTIQLPDTWADFFVDRGECPSFVGEQRRNIRVKARVQGLLWFESTPKSVQRAAPAEMLGIYTRDFSQRGCALVSPVQIFPDETLRILLPTFWMIVKTARCSRMTPHCYVVGTMLVRQQEPSDDAFDVVDEPSRQLAAAGPLAVGPASQG